MTLGALADYVGALRRLLAGETAIVDGKPSRMLHAAGLAAPRPIEVPLWLSVFGPRGSVLAGDIADGVIGPPHPTLPAAMIVSGTVLDPGEEPGSSRVREAVGPWRVVDVAQRVRRGRRRSGRRACPVGAPGGRRSRRSAPTANAIC